VFALLLSVNAFSQTAIETSKFTDNVYVSVGGQVSTPTSLDGVFPLNPAVNITLGKDFTPVVGANIEYTNWLGSNGGFDGLNHNVVRGSYLGLNSTINLTNLFLGFEGGRNFEVQTVTGLGWGHVFTPNQSDEYRNDLCAKTGANFLFNLSKAHSIYVQPAVLWNLTNPASNRNKVAFNKMGSQLALTIGYIYHFKNSNNLHTFKVHDVGALNNKIKEQNVMINKLRQQLSKKPMEVVREVPRFIEISQVFIPFEKGKSELSLEAQSTLNNIVGKHVRIIGTASPEGTNDINMKLSQERADVVANYLKDKNTIEEAIGVGVQGVTSNRLVIIQVQ
jgi:outer membrane protein OmpA-like peptidoglycan-associated protein